MLLMNASVADRVLTKSSSIVSSKWRHGHSLAKHAAGSRCIRKGANLAAPTCGQSMRYDRPHPSRN